MKLLGAGVLALALSADLADAQKKGWSAKKPRGKPAPKPAPKPKWDPKVAAAKAEAAACAAKKNDLIADFKQNCVTSCEKEPEHLRKKGMNLCDRYQWRKNCNIGKTASWALEDPDTENCRKKITSIVWQGVSFTDRWQDKFMTALTNKLQNFLDIDYCEAKHTKEVVPFKNGNCSFRCFLSNFRWLTSGKQIKPVQLTAGENGKYLLSFQDEWPKFVVNKYRNEEEANNFVCLLFKKTEDCFVDGMNAKRNKGVQLQPCHRDEDRIKFKAYPYTYNLWFNSYAGYIEACGNVSSEKVESSANTSKGNVGKEVLAQLDFTDHNTTEKKKKAREAAAKAKAEEEERQRIAEEKREAERKRKLEEQRRREEEAKRKKAVALAKKKALEEAKIKKAKWVARYNKKRAQNAMSAKGKNSNAVSFSAFLTKKPVTAQVKQNNKKKAAQSKKSGRRMLGGEQSDCPCDPRLEWCRNKYPLCPDPWAYSNAFNKP